MLYPCDVDVYIHFIIYYLQLTSCTRMKVCTINLLNQRKASRLCDIFGYILAADRTMRGKSWNTYVDVQVEPINELAASSFGSSCTAEGSDAVHYRVES